MHFTSVWSPLSFNFFSLHRCSCFFSCVAVALSTQLLLRLERQSHCLMRPWVFVYFFLSVFYGGSLESLIFFQAQSIPPVQTDNAGFGPYHFNQTNWLSSSCAHPTLHKHIIYNIHIYIYISHHVIAWVRVVTLLKRWSVFTPPA